MITPIDHKSHALSYFFSNTDNARREGERQGAVRRKNDCRYFGSSVSHPCNAGDGATFWVFLTQVASHEYDISCGMTPLRCNLPPQNRTETIFKATLFEWMTAGEEATHDFLQERMQNACRKSFFASTTF